MKDTVIGLIRGTVPAHPATVEQAVQWVEGLAPVVVERCALSGLEATGGVIFADPPTAEINRQLLDALKHASKWLDHYIDRYGAFPADILGVYGDAVRAIAAAEQQAQPEPLTCEWSHCDDEFMYGTWDGACGAKWTFTEDGPAENSMNFCPECGKRLVLAAADAKRGA